MTSPLHRAILVLEGGPTIAIPWSALSQKSYPPTAFWIDPFIPQGGIILLWGKTSIGKSPVTWEMARAIGTGTSFFGLPTKPGRVLYIEVDTPEQLMASRLKGFSSPAPNVWWQFMEPLSIPNVTPEQDLLLRAAKQEACPDVVFINTLRKVHDLDDKDSRAPKLVYSYFRHLFPLSSLFFVHHMRKSSVDPKALNHQKEGFSGANNWLNDAQTGLHLESYSGSPKQNLNLFHIKSQVTATLRPLPLFLNTAANAVLSSPLYDEYLAAYEVLNSSDGQPPGEIDIQIASRIGISPSTAKKRRLDILAGRFPGSREFLADDRLGG